MLINHKTSAAYEVKVKKSTCDKISEVLFCNRDLFKGFKFSGNEEKKVVKI